MIGNPISIGGVIFAGALFVYARWAVDYARRVEGVRSRPMRRGRLFVQNPPRHAKGDRPM